MTGISSHTLKTQQKQYKVKISSRVEIAIGTGSDQWNRNKTITKTISAGKLKDRRETNTPIK